MLGRELLNKSASTISLCIGQPIPYAELKEFTKDEDVVNYLRLNTYLMSPHGQVESAKVSFTIPVIDPVPKAALIAELAQLDKQAKLLEQGEFTVYCVPSTHIPLMMQEIGRVREISFRAVGKAAGRLAMSMRMITIIGSSLFGIESRASWLVRIAWAWSIKLSQKEGCKASIPVACFITITLSWRP